MNSHIISRRGFLALLGCSAAACAGATTPLLRRTPPARVDNSPFKVSVFTDEIGHDFARACEIAAREFDLSYVELRGLWNKSILDLDREQLDEARRILKRFGLGVTSIAGPLFKTHWPGAPRSDHGPRNSAPADADTTFREQAGILQKQIELADFFEAPHIRAFDFYRLADPAPFRDAMDEKLNEAADKAGGRGLTLVMENEHACNTGTAREAARTLAAVKSPSFKLNWDPGNDFFGDGTPFPDGYRLLPVDRIGHVHCKDARRKAGGGYEWAAMGQGEIDYVGQFRALMADGYTGPVVLETHWRTPGPGDREESTRISMAGMKDQLRRAGALK